MRLLLLALALKVVVLERVSRLTGGLVRARDEMGRMEDRRMVGGCMVLLIEWWGREGVWGSASAWVVIVETVNR